jgi:hypothetical protein
VTSVPAGIACGATCNAGFLSGTPVTLTAAPATGSTFTGWSGACSGTGACVVTMDSAKAVTANFLEASGIACVNAVDCASGFCVDGVCCDSMCGGQCQACDVVGSVGTCTTVSGQPHGARGICSGDGSVCSGSCNGTTTTCSYPGTSAMCGSAACIAGVETLQGNCSGAGSCLPGATLGCQPFVCGPNACLTSCAADADCASGYSCGSGACLPAVQITNVIPNAGPATGGTPVALTGTNFSSGAAVTVGGTTATTVQVASATSLSFTTPPGTSGWSDVVVALPDGRRATAAGAFHYVAGPTLASVSPSSGPTTGGTSVTITGSGFVAGATVSIGGPVSTVAVVMDASTIVAITEGGVAGSVDVVVQNPDGQVTTLAGAFTYIAAHSSASEELFVANWEVGSVTVYDLAASGNTAPLRTLTGPSAGLDHPVSLALDRTRDELYVGSQLNNSTDSISVFDRVAFGDSAPSRRIAGPSTQLGAPTGLALDTVHGEIVVANLYVNRITVYPITATGDAAPIRVIEGPSTGLSGPFGLYLDLAHDEIVVANYSTVTVYPRAASGDVAPLRTIQANLAWGNGLSVAGDEIFVADRSASDVAVFGRTTDGNVPPLRVIAGPATGISGPAAVLAYPVTNQVFVGNLYNHAVTVFGLSGNGDEPPLRTIQGSATGLRQPHAFAVYSATTWSLGTTKAGSGTGTVTSVPVGIDCGATCSVSLGAGTVVELLALPGAGSTFTGWTGACSGTGACFISMDAAKTVGATFVAPPTVSSLSPISWTTSGGPVTITGAGFQAGAVVTLGGVVVASTAITPTSISMTAPPHPAGVVDLVVTNPDGLSSTLATAFTYTPGLQLLALTPKVGPAGVATNVALVGTGFATGMTVTFGVAAATSVSVTDSGHASCIAPTGTGTVNVTLTLAGQTSTLPSAFTYVPRPTIASVAPASGTSLGGTPITVTGTNLLPGALVTVGGQQATGVNVAGPTQLTAITPAHAAGAVAVTVTNLSGQQRSLASAFTYVAAPAPMVVSIAPVSGPMSGGTAVVIRGTNFVPGSTVSGLSVTGLSVVDSTTITAVTTAHAAGNVAVTVRNPDGQTGTLAAAYRYNAAPSIASLSIATGSLLGKTAVAISGSGFLAGATVTFDGIPAGIGSISGGTIRVTTPAHAQGPVTVVVTNPDLQSASKPGGFTYVPATPTGLTATGGQNQIALSWAAAPGADGYNVLRSSTNGGTYSLVGTSVGATYTDTGLANGVRWFYAVQATSSSGSTVNSTTANASTLAAPPTGVTATPGARRVALAWSAATGATGYTVLRATVPGGPYTQIATPTGTTYTNTGLTTGTTYYYVVRSRNAAGAGANSVEVSSTAQ